MNRRTFLKSLASTFLASLIPAPLRPAVSSWTIPPTGRVFEGFGKQITTMQVDMAAGRDYWAIAFVRVDNEYLKVLDVRQNTLTVERAGA